MIPALRIPLGPDVEVRVVEVLDAAPAAVEIGLGLWRCSPAETSREFHRTPAALRIPLHLLPVLIEALQRIHQRAAKQRLRAGERSLFAPAPEVEP